MVHTKGVSEAVIRRLPRYYRCLADLESQGIARTSSQSLSRLLHLTASQIRQDLNCFGGFGQQGYGYTVTILKGHISRILGIDKVYRLVVVGAGNLGKALIGYTGYKNEGFFIEGVFDTNPALIGQQVGDLTIQDGAALETFIQKRAVSIGVIAVDQAHAQGVADRLVAAGVSGLWNFAPVDVLVPAPVRVENVHINDSLYVLAYRMSAEPGA